VLEILENGLPLPEEKVFLALLKISNHFRQFTLTLRFKIVICLYHTKLVGLVGVTAVEVIAVTIAMANTKSSFSSVLVKV